MSIHIEWQQSTKTMFSFRLYSQRTKAKSLQIDTDIAQKCSANNFKGLYLQSEKGNESEKEHTKQAKIYERLNNKHHKNSRLLPFSFDMNGL